MGEKLVFSANDAEKNCVYIYIHTHMYIYVKQNKQKKREP